MEQYLQISLLVLVVVQLVSRTLCVNMPSKMPQGMYCEGCIATVTELVKRVNKPSLDSREVRVVEAFEKICDYSNFDSYAYSPPKTAKACSFLLDNFDEEIEDIVYKSHDVKECEDKVCYKLTKACEGIDRDSEEHKKEMHKIDMEPPEDAIPFGRDPSEYTGEDEEEPGEDEEEPGDDEEQPEDDEEQPGEDEKDAIDDSQYDAKDDERKDGEKPKDGNEEDDDMVYYPPEPLKGELPDNVTPAGDFPGAKPVEKSEL